jgi:hypothetical protein
VQSVLPTAQRGQADASGKAKRAADELARRGEARTERDGEADASRAIDADETWLHRTVRSDRTRHGSSRIATIGKAQTISPTVRER